MWMKLEQRDLTRGKYGDYCDTCGKFEDDCDMNLYNLYLGEFNQGEESEVIICQDCSSKLKNLLSKIAV